MHSTTALVGPIVLTAHYVTLSLGLGQGLLTDVGFSLRGDLIGSPFMERLEDAGNFTLTMDPETSLFGFDKRQPRCPAGSHSCPAGKCCENEYRCVDNGCCKGSRVLCGLQSCYDPATDICCNDGSACRKGYDCVPGGCCRSGLKLCGSRKCYDPKTEKCCENGACLKSDKCCDNECCRSIAYCGSDGYCAPCPASTRTMTSTYSSTVTSVLTQTSSQAPQQSDEHAGFSCVPTTATNAEGATLELSDDCALSYQPPHNSTSVPEPPNTSEASREERNIDEYVPLDLRQAGCTPYTTYTSTVIQTVSVTSRSTTSRTVTVEPSDEGFSCPGMTATNAAGDELSLNVACELEFTPAEPTEPSSQAGNSGVGNSFYYLLVAGGVVLIV